MPARKYASPSEEVKHAVRESERRLRARYEIQREAAPLTHTKARDRYEPAVDSGVRCEGCGWPSSRFPTRRSFKEHREDCEANASDLPPT